MMIVLPQLTIITEPVVERWELCLHTWYYVGPMGSLPETDEIEICLSIALYSSHLAAFSRIALARASSLAAAASRSVSRRSAA